MASVCAKCGDQITKNPKLACKHCDKQYHLHCTTVSENRFFNTLTGAHRENWKCEKCYTQVLQTEDFTENDNVSHRKKNRRVINISTDNSFASLSVESDDEEECEVSIPEEKTDLNQSCPEIRTLNCITEIENLKEKLADAKLQLLGADQEIEKLLAENYSLKELLDKKDCKIKQLQNLLMSSTLSLQLVRQSREENRGKEFLLFQAKLNI